MASVDEGRRNLTASVRMPGGCVRFPDPKDRRDCASDSHRGLASLFTLSGIQPLVLRPAGLDEALLETCHRDSPGEIAGAAFRPASSESKDFLASYAPRLYDRPGRTPHQVRVTVWVGVSCWTALPLPEVAHQTEQNREPSS